MVDVSEDKTKARYLKLFDSGAKNEPASRLNWLRQLRQDAAEQSANFFACMKKFGKSPLFEISAIVSKIQPCLRLEIFAVGIRQL